MACVVCFCTVLVLEMTGFVRDRSVRARNMQGGICRVPNSERGAGRSQLRIRDDCAGRGRQEFLGEFLVGAMPQQFTLYDAMSGTQRLQSGGPPRFRPRRRIVCCAMQGLTQPKQVHLLLAPRAGSRWS